MALYTKTYWKQTASAISSIISDDVILHNIFPLIYVNLERLRFNTFTFLMPLMHKPLSSSKYVHPLILLGMSHKRETWFKNMDKMISEMNYEQLINIQNSPSHFHFLHYYYWKNRGFPSNYKFERNNVNSRTLWNYEEVKEFKRWSKVVITFPEEKSQSFIDGYVSFDYKTFEGKRRYIGISKTKELVEVFDITKYPKGSFKIYIEKKVNDSSISTKVDGLHYQTKLSDPIKPWEIKEDTLISMTHGDSKERHVDHYCFLKRAGNFTKWIVRNQQGKEEKLDLLHFDTPVFYMIKKKALATSSTFIRVVSTIYFIYPSVDASVKYKIIVKRNDLLPNLIPKLIEGTMLGGLGREMIIKNDNIYLTSFKLFNDCIDDNLKRFVNTIQNYVPDANISVHDGKITELTLI